MSVNIPRISGLSDPKISKILESIKLAIEDLSGGEGRAVRVSDLGSSFLVRDGGIDLNPIVVPSVAPEIRRRIEALEATTTDLSTLAEELLGTGRFGSLLAGQTVEAKTLSVNVNGHIAGYAVAAYSGASGEVTSDFIVQADRFAVVRPSPAWLANQAYSLGQFITATVASGVGNVLFEVTTAGTTGATEPTWNTTLGGTTTSGTAVFTARAINQRVPFVVGNIGGVQGVGITGSLVVDGTITATAIAANAITADKIAAQAVTAEKIAANLVLASTIEISSSGHIRSGQTAYNTGTGWFLGNVSGTPKFSIGSSGGNRVTWDGTTLTVVGTVSGNLDGASITGTIPPDAFDIAALGWTMDNTFSATDADTVSWTSGTLYTAAGDSYSIASGNTGNMTQRTYIYLDISVSTTAFQTTTNAANAVGAGRILVAVAEDDTTTAFFQVFGGSGSFGSVAPEIPAFGPLANGNFETGTGVGWVSDASWAVSTTTIITGSTYCARIATSGTGLRSDPFAVAAGDRLLVTCVAKRDGGSLPDASLDLNVRWEDSSGGFLSFSSTSSASSASSAIQFLRLIVTAPASTARARIVIAKNGGASGHWFVDDVFVTPMIKSADVDLALAAGVIDLGSQISGTLTTAFAAAGLINSNVTINADGTLSGAGGGQASLNSLPGTIALGTKTTGNISVLPGVALPSQVPSGLGTAINRDPNVSDAAAWATFSGSNWEIGTITDGKVGNTELRSTASASHAWVAETGRYPVDTGRNYLLSAWVRRKSGNRGVYLVCNFYDSSGALIAGSSLGWLSFGTSFYWGLAAADTTTLPADSAWRQFTGTFGPNQTAQIPSGAKTMSLGAILNYQGSGTTDGVAAVQDLRVEPMVTSGLILANAIGTTHLAAAAVTAAKISAGTITANEIAAATITGNRIAANTIAAANIVALTITAAEIAAATITAGKIASATITANEIAANTITAAQVALNTLTASNIAASSITGSRIAAATILGTNIAGATITASNIAAGTITANELAANAVVANTIATGAVTAGKLAATLIYGGEIVVDTNGMIRSGQSSFNTGVGFFIGNSGGTPVFSIGDSAGSQMTWDGALLSIVGSVRIAGQQRQLWFPDGWNGFGTPPNAPFNYYDFGDWVMMWYGSAATGISNSSTTMQAFFLPVELRPSSTRYGVMSIIDGGSPRMGEYEIRTDGVINWLRHSADTFTTVFFGSGGKAPRFGATMIWAK